jgi:hypothetical protein
MNSLSPTLRRFAAIAALVALLWAAALSAFQLVSSRVGTEREIAEARGRYEMLRSRRLDIATLQQQLTSLQSSDEVKSSAISAATGKAAVATIQQASKRAVESAGGRFLSSVESAATQVAGTVALQFRARLAEENVAAMLGAIEKNDPQLDIETLQLGARAEKVGSPAEIEVTAVVRARWSLDARRPQ